MYSNCGCNREFDFNDGCGYNRPEWSSGCGYNNDYYNDNAALYEAERAARATLRRRDRENRCTRGFVHCMKNTRCGY